MAMVPAWGLGVTCCCSLAALASAAALPSSRALLALAEVAVGGGGTGGVSGSKCGTHVYLNEYLMYQHSAIFFDPQATVATMQSTWLRPSLLLPQFPMRHNIFTTNKQ